MMNLNKPTNRPNRLTDLTRLNGPNGHNGLPCNPKICDILAEEKEEAL
ncbi:hypothetical protein J7M23_06835 [Candidatus Sumerlaeota bacterium]|nr:hypothetical protein [Candidatus Sumerlaeota bacterium]